MTGEQKQNKVCAIVCFHKQKHFKKRVLDSIRPQVEQLIVVEDKGDLTTQREIGIKKIKKGMEYVLFCDGDIVVSPFFVYNAINELNYDYQVGVVGGLITTPMLTPAQEFMGVLRLKGWHSDLLVDACFLTRAMFFRKEKQTRNVWFSPSPHSTIGFHQCLRDRNYRQRKILDELLHLGEPETIKELLVRQARYGTRKKNNVLVNFFFNNTPFGRLGFLKYYKAYRFLWNGLKLHTTFLTMMEIYNSFIGVHYHSSHIREMVGEE